jgi:hypothetical protein
MSSRSLQSVCQTESLETDSFVDAFLKYLDLRHEADPIPHYAVAAMYMCTNVPELKSRHYPDLVVGFLQYFSHCFLFADEIDDFKDKRTPLGQMPFQPRQSDPLPARWNRFKDCCELLLAWLGDDMEKLDRAFLHQLKRAQFVELVEKTLLESKTKGEAWDNVAVELGDQRESSKWVKNKYNALIGNKWNKLAFAEYVPIALLRTERGFSVFKRRSLWFDKDLHVPSRKRRKTPKAKELPHERQQ